MITVFTIDLQFICQKNSQTNFEFVVLRYQISDLVCQIDM